jgi:hypothetical protein
MIDPRMNTDKHKKRMFICRMISRATRFQSGFGLKKFRIGLIQLRHSLIVLNQADISKSL